MRLFDDACAEQIAFLNMFVCRLYRLEWSGHSESMLEKTMRNFRRDGQFIKTYRFALHSASRLEYSAIYSSYVLEHDVLLLSANIIANLG